jgi:hypothetical protein
MDRLQLKQCLQAAGVPDDRYLLVGLDPPRAVREGACIVRPNQRSWEVLMWEPVRLEPSLTFLNEGEACDYVLDVLTAPAEPPSPLAVPAPSGTGTPSAGPSRPASPEILTSVTSSAAGPSLSR